jgi:hypothetical protein
VLLLKGDNDIGATSVGNRKKSSSNAESEKCSGCEGDDREIIIQDINDECEGSCIRSS